MSDAIVRSCETCGESFSPRATDVARGYGRFCSRACSGAGKTAERVASLALVFAKKLNKEGPVPAHCPELGPCWEWLGSFDGKGYGCFQLDPKKRVRSHRYAFFIEHGRWPVPWGLHKCDNKKCNRPSHLYEGTPKENSRDSVERGRLENPVFHGEEHGMAKLTDAKVIEIFRRVHTNETCAALALEFDVSSVLVSLIKRRKIWRHLALSAPTLIHEAPRASAVT